MLLPHDEIVELEATRDEDYLAIPGQLRAVLTRIARAGCNTP